MKTYVKPEFSIDSLLSASSVANDPFDFGTVTGDESEISTNDWWDLLGNAE